jgi:hypothetical protein
MGHGPCTFKKRDVKVALQAAREAGLEVARVEVGKDGKIAIIASKPLESDDSKRNEWDEELNGAHQTQTR